MTDAERIAEIRKLFYSDSITTNDVRSLIAHIDKLEARIATAEAVVEDVRKWRAVGNAPMDLREVVQSTKKLITTLTAHDAHVAETKP